jgi:hypothetical protein
MATTQLAANDEPTDEEYNASITEMMKTISRVCNGKPLGIVTCALFNCLCFVAETSTPELRKLMTESANELIANIESVDAPRH